MNKKNTDTEVLESLNTILKEYDAIFTSFVSLSSNNIIKSKNKILKHVKTIIKETLSDVILLKKTVGTDNAQYIHIINEIYKRVYDGVMLVYNHEFNKLNNLAHSKSVLLDTNLAPYVSLLNESSKNILNIDCEIKQRLNHSLGIIKQNSNYFQDLKSEINTRGIGRIFRCFLFGENKITLLKITEDYKNLISRPNNERLQSERKESALNRYSNL